MDVLVLKVRQVDLSPEEPEMLEREGTTAAPVYRELREKEV